MTIGIDASRANKSNKTGTEWYSYHIIEELKKITGHSVIPAQAGIQTNSDKTWIPGQARNDASALPDSDKILLYTNSDLTGGLEKLPANFVEKDLRWPPKYLWTQIRLWWELLISPPDVLLVPAHTIPFLPLPKKIKVCVNVHDVGFKRFPQLYKPIQVWYHDLTMRRIKQRADVIITISEFSKQEIIKLYGVAPEKIKVVYLGFDASKFFVQASDSASPAILEKYKIAKPYLLYVGRLEKKKNIANMISAFALAKSHFITQDGVILNEAERSEGSQVLPDDPSQVKDDNINLKLVLAGGAGNQFEEIKKIITDSKLENEVIITGYVDQADLPIIYNHAAIFLFPTLYEGFGLPILEGMASGVPVITSNFAPHTEVGGDAAYYADPHSPQALADGIIKMLTDSEFKQSLIAKGLERVKEFFWHKTANEILNIIKI